MAGKAHAGLAAGAGGLSGAAGDRRRALRRRRGRGALPGPARRDAGRGGGGVGDRRGLHPVGDALGAGALVRGEARGAAATGDGGRASPSSSTRATPTPSPAAPAARRSRRPPAPRPRRSGVPVGHVFVASTGVIGEPLPAERIVAALAGLRDGLAADAAERAARAIMTTDTFPKGAVARVELGGVPVTIMGFAKGSGMIAPDMATMLVFLFTDAAVARGAAAGGGRARGRRDLQLHHRRRRHLDLGHARSWPRPAGRRCRRSQARRPAAARLRGGADRGDARPRAAGGARRRGGDEVRRGPGDRRGEPRPTRARSGCRSPTRRWSRRRSPARTRTGAGSSWRWASPGAAADRDRLTHPLRRHPGGRGRAGSRPPTARRTGRPT